MENSNKKRQSDAKVQKPNDIKMLFGKNVQPLPMLSTNVTSIVWQRKIFNQPFSWRLHHRAHREAVLGKAFPQNVLEMVGNGAYKTNLQRLAILKPQEERLNEGLETSLYQIMDIRMPLIVARELGETCQIARGLSAVV